jgi:hypothetical protein
MDYLLLCLHESFYNERCFAASHILLCLVE